MNRLIVVIGLFFFVTSLFGQNTPLVSGYSDNEKEYLNEGKKDKRTTIIISNETNANMFIKLNGIKVNTQPCKCLEIRNNPMDRYKIIADVDDVSTPWYLNEFDIKTYSTDIGMDFYYTVSAKTYGTDKKLMYSLTNYLVGKPAISKEIWANRCIIDKKTPSNNFYPNSRPAKAIEKPATPNNNNGNSNNNGSNNDNGNTRPNPNIPPNNNPVSIGQDCLPMTPSRFNEKINSLNNTHSSFSRKDLAEIIARNNCLNSNQVKSVLLTLSGSFDQKDFAIYAYTYCSDPQNYTRVIDALSSEIMKDEVRKATIAQASPRPNPRPNPNNTGGVGQNCYPISPSRLNEKVNSLKNTSSSFSRKDLAETIARNNCLNSNQVKSVLLTLSGSFDQKDFAIYAYTYCSDPQNYTRVIDALSSEIMKDEVRKATIGR